MPSELPERIKRLMEDQAEEAPLPVSYSTLRVRDEAPEPPGESDESTPTPSDEVPQNEQAPAPEDWHPPPEESAEVHDITTPEQEDDGERGEAGWEELLTEFEPPQTSDQPDDPYARAMADVDWKMALQSRSESLT